MVVDLNSFICRRLFFANKKNTFANLSQLHVFLSRSYGYPSFCYLDTLKLHLNGNCVSDLGDSQRKIQGHVGIIPSGNNKLSLFPGSRDAAKVLRGLWGMGTFSFVIAFAELSRKNPLQINQEIHNLNRAWGRSST